MTDRSRFDELMRKRLIYVSAPLEPNEFEMSYREACDDDCLMPPCVHEKLELFEVQTDDPLFEGCMDFHVSPRRLRGR